MAANDTALVLLVVAMAACERPQGGASCDETLTSWADRDGDGFGDPATETALCTIPAGSVDNDRDCDDGSTDVHPGAEETCDAVDDDCDGIVDPDPTTWFVDADGDGYGSPNGTTDACAMPDGYAASGDDCNDANDGVHPGASEVCNGVDDDCVGGADDPFDADGDGHVASGCGLGDDCDDADVDVHPGVVDACGDGVDADCLDGDPYCVAFSGDLSLADADSITYSQTDWEELGDGIATGDVNGDGLPEILGGAQGIDGYSGGAYVLYGALDGAHGASEVGYRLENDSDGVYRCGASVSLGDINGDGYDDAGIGCYEGMRVELGPIDVDVDLADASLVVSGPPTSFFGCGHDIGDVNGDGHADLVVGAHFDDSGTTQGGAVYVAYGPLDGGELDMYESHDVALVDNTYDDQAGLTVHVGGDFDADGLDDLLVRSLGYVGAGGFVNEGATYVLFGPVDADRALDEPDAILYGASWGSFAGSAMSQGDSDGDGVTDIALGAPGTSDGMGSAYVLLGPFSGVVELDAYAAFKIYGAMGSRHMGSGAALGDANGDLQPDLLVGAEMDGRGTAYYFEAPLSGGSVAAEDATAVFSGEHAGDAAGTNVLLTDLDVDGTADVVISAIYADTGAAGSGTIYTFLSD